MTKVIHFLSLSGLGGVQQMFNDFYKISLKNIQFKHIVYSNTKIESSFYQINDYKIDNFWNKLWLIKQFYSKNSIIHYYNNLGSKGLNSLLKLIPSSNIILHEHGTVWNAKEEEKKIYQENIKNSILVLTNSNATKIMLHKKFDIPLYKMKVLYNGIPIVKVDKKQKDIQKFIVGFIGRLDSHKGVHILIEAAKRIKDKNIIFQIAGSGNVEKYLKDLAKGILNIEFVGRVKNPYDFISSLDILVVPSIREPLGNVVLEAGLCKVPVIASAVDGIPEMIEDGINGILLKPKNNISIKLDEKTKITFPKFVVNPDTKELIQPKEIDSDELVDSIFNLLNDKELSYNLANNLYETVINKFSIERFTEDLEYIYKELNDN